jgi:hypothetical protein
VHTALSMRRSVSPDLHRGFDAMVATAIGTMAGLLADSGFGVRMSIVNAAYRWLHPVFDVFSAHPIFQLILADFIYRTPIALIIGLSVGLILRYIRYARLLVGSILVWPICLAGRGLLFVFLPPDGGQATSASVVGTTAPRSDVIPELVLYLMQYALLFLIIYLTHAVLLHPKRQMARTGELKQ